MKALILAGGQSTRLRPLTNNAIKSLFPLDENGNCIIDSQVNSLIQNDIKDIIIVTGFQSKEMRAYLQRYSKKAKITFIENKEYAKTKPSYAFTLVKDYLDKPFIYINGDVIFDEAILRQIKNNNHKAVTAVQKNEGGEVNIQTNSSGEIKAIGKNIDSKGSHQFVGITKISGSFLEAFRKSIEFYEERNEKNLYAVDVINKAVQDFGGKMHIDYVNKFLVAEIDTKEDLEYARELWEQMRHKNTPAKIVSFLKIFSFFKVITIWLFYFISLIVPKNKTGIVFTGWHNSGNQETFADNSKYLYLYASQHHKDLDAVWISRDRKLITLLNELGYKAAHIYSIHGIWKAIRANYTIIDALFKREHWQFSGRSKVIQLWHGRAIKNVNTLPDANLFNKLKTPNRFVRFHKITASSDYGVELMQQAFKQGKDTIPITGYPRNDVFFRNIEDSQIDTHLEIIELIKKAKQNDSEHKHILYAPTFRRSEKNARIDSFFSSQDLSDWLKNNNISLLLSFHPKYRGQLRHQIHNNIIPISDKDSQPLLKETDMLITDYSSSFADYLLTDSPMIFFAYDFDEYTQREGLAVNYDTHMPGHVIKNIDDLLNAIQDALLNDPYKQKRKETKDLYHKYKDGNSSQRIIEIIKEEIK